MLAFARNEPYAFSMIASFVVCVLFRLGTAPLRQVTLQAVVIALLASLFTAWVAVNFDPPFYALINTFGAPSILLSHFIAIGRRPSRQKSTDTVSPASPTETMAPKRGSPAPENIEQIANDTSHQSPPSTKDLQGFVTLTPIPSSHESATDHVTLSNHVDIEPNFRIPKQSQFVEMRNPKRNEAGLIVPPVANTSEYMADNAFIRDSLQYASATIEAKPAEISFHQYWPTFSSLSIKQLQWYLWWRSEWLSGSTKETYTSYLFLLAYELINFTLVPDKQRAFALLKRLHDDFRSTGPIDNHLSRWTADMAWELGLDNEAFALYMDREPEVAQAVGRMINRKSPSPDVELDILISKYRYRSKYFEENEAELRRLFREAIRDGIQFFGQEGINFFEALGQRPGKEDSRPWKLYNSARVHRFVHFRPLYRAAQPGYISCMQDFFRALENLHREQAGIRRGLKVKYLPEDVQNFIKRRRHAWKSLPKADVPPTQASAQVKVPTKPRQHPPDIVTIDTELLERLKRETEASQQLANEWLNESSGDADISIPQSTTHVADIPRAEDIAVASTPLAPSPSNEAEEFTLRLPRRARRLLREVKRRGEWGRSDAERWAREQGGLLTSFLDDINERTVDYFGHPLVYVEDERVRLDEETMEMLMDQMNTEVFHSDEDSPS